MEHGLNPGKIFNRETLFTQLIVHLILGYRAIKNWDLELVAAMFSPGSGFDVSDNAYMGKIQLRYRF